MLRYVMHRLNKFLLNKYPYTLFRILCIIFTHYIHYTIFYSRYAKLDEILSIKSALDVLFGKEKYMPT